MNYQEQKERYHNDPEFYFLVNTIHAFLMEGNFTVSELKDAVIFAGIKFETERVRPITLKGFWERFGNRQKDITGEKWR